MLAFMQILLVDVCGCAFDIVLLQYFSYSEVISLSYGVNIYMRPTGVCCIISI